MKKSGRKEVRENTRLTFYELMLCQGCVVVKLTELHIAQQCKRAHRAQPFCQPAS